MCCREALKKMKILGERGCKKDRYIINISSVHKSTPNPLGTPYATSKREHGNAN